MAREQRNANLQREITSLHGELSLKTNENTHLLETIATLETDAKLYTEQVACGSVVTCKHLHSRELCLC